MTIKTHSTLLLLAASITLAGCQTTEIVPPKTTPQYENIRTMQADSDSDGDGVPDELDMCPNTPENVVVDDRGCHFITGPDKSLKMEYRAFFTKGSSELSPKYQAELDKVSEIMNLHNTATMRIEGSISENEIDDDGLISKSNTLAKNRALMVKNYLVVKHGIAPSRLTTLNCEARAPIAPNDTKDGRSFNRRVYGLVIKPEEQEDNDYPSGIVSSICVEF